MGSISHGDRSTHGVRDNVVRIVAFAATLFVAVDAVAAFRATTGTVQHLSALIVVAGALAVLAILFAGLLRRPAAETGTEAGLATADAIAAEPATQTAGVPAQPRIRRTQRLRLTARTAKPGAAAGAQRSWRRVPLSHPTGTAQ